MTEERWSNIARPHDLFRAVVGQQRGRRRGHRRKRILLCCACCRRVWDLLTDEALRCAVELAERDADNYVFTSDLGAACDTLRRTIPRIDWNMSHLRQRYTAVLAASSADVPLVLSCTSSGVLDRDARKEEREAFVATETAAHLALLHDVFGNPFRPATFSPEWRTDTAVSLARQMYESRDFGAMPILADALQDAGCDSPDILGHCRDANQVHVRGCWVVDLVLGKE